jgi:hypothetical protein
MAWGGSIRFLENQEKNICQCKDVHLYVWCAHCQAHIHINMHRFIRPTIKYSIPSIRHGHGFKFARPGPRGAAARDAALPGRSLSSQGRAAERFVCGGFGAHVPSFAGDEGHGGPGLFNNSKNDKLVAAPNKIETAAAIVYVSAYIQVYFDVTRVLQHADMILAEVALPESLPCAKANPHVTLCRSEHVAPIFAQTLLENPSSCVALDTRKLRLCGVVDLEEGPARPGQVREKREADVAEGTWVHVKKHSSMGCAVVTLPTPAVRDAILLRCSKVVLQGNSLELKKHHQKQGMRVGCGWLLYV